MFAADLKLINAGWELILQLLFFGFLFYIVERIRKADPDIPFIKKDLYTELALAVLNGTIFTPVFTFLLGLTVIIFYQSFLPYQLFDDVLSDLPMIVQVLLGAFIIDFSTYWRHRFTHNYMWSFHSIHHSAKQLTWISGLRLHPIDLFIAIVFDTTLLYIFGFSGEGMVFAVLFVAFYNFFTHANLDLKYSRPFRYIFASPNFHRWHHATDKSAYDKNFCAVFSCLDLAFGTYYHPEELPRETGLSPGQQKSYPVPLHKQLLYPFNRIYKKLSKKTLRVDVDINPDG